MLPLILAAAIPSTPALGLVEGRCRADEQGPAVVITVVGLKDRQGRLKAELYPARNEDFLADDNVLVGAGKVFRRTMAQVPASGDPHLCLRAPTPGIYALAVMHMRGAGSGFQLSRDGIGFGGNPKLHLRKPTAAEAEIRVGPGPTPARIVMNYRRGLFSFGPID